MRSQRIGLFRSSPFALGSRMRPVPLSSSEAPLRKVSASAVKFTPSSRNLPLIEGNSDGEHRPVPSSFNNGSRSIFRINQWKVQAERKQRYNESPVKQFPGENLIVREGKLFCSGCREILSPKKSVLKIHFSSKKHQTGKEKLKKSKLKHQTIIEAFRREVCTFCLK